MSLNVSLTPHLQEFIRSTVDSGRFQSASEVVRAALRIFEEQENQRAVKFEALRQSIQEGLGSGPAVPLDIEELVRECAAEFGGGSA